MPSGNIAPRLHPWKPRKNIEFECRWHRRLALVHSRRIAEHYLAIDFAPAGVERLPATLQITRTRRLATAYEMAGRFISRILQ
jgi:hypothetical protein